MEQSLIPWNQLIKTDEVITAADTNIDLSQDYSDPSKLPFHTRKLTRHYKLLYYQILNQGVEIVNKE